MRGPEVSQEMEFCQNLAVRDVKGLISDPLLNLRGQIPACLLNLILLARLLRLPDEGSLSHQLV